MKKLLLLTAVLLMSFTTAFASEFPSKPVKIITSLPVGSGPDVAIRKISEQLSARWKQPVFVENRPGGNSAVALEAFNKEANDGHVIFFADSGVFTSYPTLYAKSDAVSHLDPLAGLLLSNLIMITSPDIKDFNQLKESIKKSPSYGSWGVGTASHLNGAEIYSYLGVEGTHIPYKDYNQWFIDVNNKLLPFSFATIASSRKLEEGGKLRYMAYAADARDPRYPNVPTIKELTGKDIGFSKAYTIITVKDSTPKATRDRIAKDVNEVLATPQMRESLGFIGYLPWELSPAELKKYIDADVKLYRRLINKHKVTVN